MKYGTVNLGQIEALINLIGGEDIVMACLRGEKKITVSDAAQLFFDKNGRGIYRSDRFEVGSLRRDLSLGQLTIYSLDDYKKRIRILHDFFGVNTGIKAIQFRDRVFSLVEAIRRDSEIFHLSKGCFVPVILPRFEVDSLGVYLNYVLEKIGKSYVSSFSGRSFCNVVNNFFGEETKVYPNVGQDTLMKRMRGKHIVGLYFPMALSGFSVGASRRFAENLPSGFALSGIDALVAMIMYPDYFARNNKCPHINLSGLTYLNDRVLGFCAGEDSLIFHKRPVVNNMKNNTFTNGLFFSDDLM